MIVFSKLRLARVYLPSEFCLLWKYSSIVSPLDPGASFRWKCLGKSNIVGTGFGFVIGNPGSLCVTRDITQVNYREHMRRSLRLKICWKMELKIVETYYVASFCCP